MSEKRTYLGEAIKEFLLEKEVAEGRAFNTLRLYKQTLSHFLTFCGQIPVSALTRTHFQGFVAKRLTHRSRQSVNVDRNSIREFARYLYDHQLVSRDKNLVGRIRNDTVVPTQFRRIPREDFPAFLKVSGDIHPRNRAFAAFGLDVLGRGDSEIAQVRIGDLDLVNGYAWVTQLKTTTAGHEPLSNQLVVELREWLNLYERLIGEPLNDRMYLFPALVRTRQFVDGIRVVQPRKPVTLVSRWIQDALKALGWDDARKCGGHTLRRSGALAAYKDLQYRLGHGRAIAIVQARLHHKSPDMTERYLGIDHDRAEMEAWVREADILVPREPAVAPVVPLRAAGGGVG